MTIDAAGGAKTIYSNTCWVPSPSMSMADESLNAIFVDSFGERIEIPGTYVNSATSVFVT